MICDENFSSFLADNGYIVEYTMNEETTETRVRSKDGEGSKLLQTFLVEDVNESLHEMIRTKVLTATRTFHHRVNAFKNEILLGKNNPMHVKYMSYRVEFQGRGAAHIHGTLWLNIQKIQNSPPFKNVSSGEQRNHLSEAFQKLRDDLKLSKPEKDAIAILTDQFVTCSLNPAIVTQKVVDIALKVNCHYCTRKCQSRCKYNFPRFPLKNTLVIDKHEFDDVIEDTSLDITIEEASNFRKILIDVQEILKDEEKMNALKIKFPNKGVTQEENYQFRAERIDEMLKLAGGISYDKYIMAIKKAKRHGSAVLLQRDIDEIYVNNYNPEWLEAWDANLDIQPVLDFFAVITYVTDYWAKPDEGLTPILREAAKKLKSEPEQKKRCQEMANTFMTNRQMGEAEAYYKILPNLTLKYSSVDTIFVPSDKKALRSKFLMKLDENDVNFNKGSQIKGGKEGTFLEKADIIDKYCRQDMTNSPEFAELRPSQFAKMYEPYQRKKTAEIKEEDLEQNPDEQQDNDIENNYEVSNMNNDSEDEDGYEVANIIITPKPFMRIPLPKIIKIKDPLPGEVALWKKRDFPKAMRIHKKRQDTDPYRYFLSELMLYTAYTDEQELGCDDEERCK